ncbi:MAG TPA: hypothetical protein VJB99_03390 [Patescibacteria group bacterium]|nr:hypothetical protein [Patescibacteria group bacterium]
MKMNDPMAGRSSVVLGCPFLLFIFLRGPLGDAGSPLCLHVDATKFLSFSGISSSNNFFFLMRVKPRRPNKKSLAFLKGGS